MFKVEGIHYIYAEYCPGPWFWGWWLYAVPIVDDKPDRDRYTCLKFDWQLNPLREQLLNLPPSYEVGNVYVTAKTFVVRHPAGLVCKVEHNGRRFAKVESDRLGDYGRMVREAQLIDFRKALEAKE